MQNLGNFIDGKWIKSEKTHPVLNPYNQKKLAEYSIASSDHVELAVQASEKAFTKFSKTSRFARSRLLALMVQELKNRETEFLRDMMEEAGKPLKLAKVEFSRALQTFTIASEEVKRFGGEIYPLDTDAGGVPFGLSRCLWFPRGVILGITPFNFPLNLVAHKVAPALASGSAIVIKVAPQTPSAGLRLAMVFEAALEKLNTELSAESMPPKAALQVLFTDNAQAEKMVSDPRIAMVSFTGSAKVGWMLQEKAIGKKLCLELGGNAANIVHEDADLDRAANRLAFGAFSYAGQSCISVQRIYVHQNIYEKFSKKLIDETLKLKSGDPKDEAVVNGPMIDQAALKRITSWIDSAVKKGAKVLCGGKSEGSVLSPTLLSQVAATELLICEEAFAPVAVLEPYSDFNEAILKVNSTKYGLQAGVFTNNHRLMEQAITELEVGGVIFNEVSAFRSDLMPYGGVKGSGLGREGIRAAMEEFSEKKMVVEYRL